MNMAPTVFLQRTLEGIRYLLLPILKEASPPGTDRRGHTEEKPSQLLFSIFYLNMNRY